MLRIFSSGLLLIALFAGVFTVAAQQQPPAMIDIAVALEIGEPLRDVLITPDAQNVFAITDSGAVLGFAFDRMASTLTPLEGFPLELTGPSHRPAALTINASGTLIFIAHDGLVGRSLLAPVTVLGRNPATFAVSVIEQFSLPVSGGMASEAATTGTLTAISSDASGTFLALANNAETTLMIIRHTRPQILPPGPVADPNAPQIQPPGPAATADPLAPQVLPPGPAQTTPQVLPPGPTPTPGS